jgi:hypothetical protein
LPSMCSAFGVEHAHAQLADNAGEPRSRRAFITIAPGPDGSARRLRHVALRERPQRVELRGARPSSRRWPGS